MMNDKRYSLMNDQNQSKSSILYLFVYYYYFIDIKIRAIAKKFGKNIIGIIL